MQTSLRTTLRKSLAHNPYRGRVTTLISNISFARPQQFRMFRSSFGYFYLLQFFACSYFCGFPAKGYTKEHEVVHLDKSTGIGTISITDHAQSVLGDVVFVELPKPGDEVVQGGMYRPHPIYNEKTTLP